MEQQYDSSKDTLLHIKRVSELMTEACKILIDRANKHDNSKLQEPEKSYFDKYTPELAALSFGTPEYEESKQKLKPALDHHYANNSHHPQHYDDGVAGMNLFDLVEMFFDWKASSERQNDGNICKSIKINQGTYEISDQLASILTNTVKYLGW